MALVASDKGSNFKPAPAGTHLAVCVQVIDLGHQRSKFNDKIQHKILFAWELPQEVDDSGKPYMVWNRYTLSLNEKANLCKDLEAWRGRKFTEEERKGFDLKNVLGKPCLLNIVHETDDGKTYANIAAIMATPKGQVIPAQVHPTLYFEIGDWDQPTFDKFSDNLKKTIEASEERTKAKEAERAPSMAVPPRVLPSPGPGMGDDDADIPF